MINQIYRFCKKTKFKLLLLFQKDIKIPSYEFKRGEIDKYIKKFNLKVLVETGTFQGDTVEYFKDKLPQIFSIELSADFAENAKKRFSSSPNVTIIEGDSGEILNHLVIEINQPTIFWLDGHYSSEFYIGDKYFITAKGKLNTPIISELTAILETDFSHVILIDDARLFVGRDDYPSIKQIRKFIQRTNNNYSLHIKDDIIYILPNASASA